MVVAKEVAAVGTVAAAAATAVVVAVHESPCRS